MNRRKILFGILITVLVISTFLSSCAKKKAKSSEDPVSIRTDEQTPEISTPTGEITAAPTEVVTAVPTSVPTEEPATPTPTPDPTATANPQTDEPATPTSTANPRTDEPATPTNTANPRTAEPATPTPTPTPTPVPTRTPIPSLDPASVKQEKMPSIYIVTDNGQNIEGNNTDHPNYHSKITVTGCEKKYELTNVPAKVRVRGNSTAGAAKKPYKISFDEKQPMLGLNEGHSFRNWCLLADFYDESGLRNYTAFKLGKLLLEDKWFCSDCMHVSVYVNGDYRGVYLLCEQTQIKKNRINIDKKADDDKTTLKTGYLLIGQGGIWWEENYFDIPIGYSVVDRDGKTMNYGAIRFSLSGGSDYSQAQRDYVSDYVSKVFKVIKSAVYDDEYYKLDKDGKLTKNAALTIDKTKTKAQKQKETVAAVFDIEAAARMCVLDEIVKNLDAMTFNLYVDLSPEGSGVVTPAAPWDFDHAMAKTKYSSTHSTTGWYATNLSVSDGTRVNFLYVMLGHIDWFEEMMIEIWQENYYDILETVYNSEVEIYRYKPDFDAEWAKWGAACEDRRLNTQTGHHVPEDMRSFKVHSDAGEFVVNWLRKRITWINNRWGTEDTRVEEPKAKDVVINFTGGKNTELWTGCRRCYVEPQSDCIAIKLEQAYDPYLYIELEALTDGFTAEDYTSIEIDCYIPKSNGDDSYLTELFLCTGGRETAEGGASVTFTCNKTNGFTTVSCNLSESPHWRGTVHRIRYDYFSSCQEGDVIYVREIRLIAAK